MVMATKRHPDKSYLSSLPGTLGYGERRARSSVHRTPAKVSCAGGRGQALEDQLCRGGRSPHSEFQRGVPQGTQEGIWLSSQTLRDQDELSQPWRSAGAAGGSGPGSSTRRIH